MSVPYQELYFNAYRPLREDYHPDHVNWRSVGGQTPTWIRQDGMMLQRNPSIAGWSIDHRNGEIENLRASVVGSPNDEAAMGYLDIILPCPAPPPMAGQVWASYHPNGGGEMMVTAVIRDAFNQFSVAFGGAPQPNVEWPPPAAILVAGPGAPWEDTAPAPDPEAAQS